MKLRERLRAFWDNVRSQHVSPKEMAAAVFVGTFLGIVPLYGIQTVCVLAAAQFFKLNKWVCLAAAQISMPPMAVVLIIAGLMIGEFVRFGEMRWVSFDEGQTFMQELWMLSGTLPDKFLSCLIGDAILGAVLGAIFATIAYHWAARRQLQKLDDPEASQS